MIVWAGASLAWWRWVHSTLPGRDPYIVPLMCFLSGLGILTIWRLDPGFGARQSVWFVVSLLLCALAIHFLQDLTVLQEHKYVLLAAGLGLTALTLLLGTNPSGSGPRLWLGCCGLYIQPSEPLRLLLVVYLAAYLADYVMPRARFFPSLVPTLFVTGLALALLLAQRDLGTAAIFILLHTTMLFLATGRRRVLVATAAALLLAAFVGYRFEPVIHARIDSWFNPWADPSGLSYQVIQSLLAVANGGILGRGPGLGSPSLVPVAHSDFIFSALAEESGLVGGVGILLAHALLLSRGLLVAMRAPSRFERLLAAGVTASLGIQALVIIGGNLRLLPLTGVTLPFVSYGGSSLLTSCVGATALLIISERNRVHPVPLDTPLPYALLAWCLAVGVLLSAFTQAWWAMARAPGLLARTDNPRRAIADRYVIRGSLLDRSGTPLDSTMGAVGSLRREYAYPQLAPVLGYTHPSLGQAGLEASLDDYLRGLRGNPISLIAWDGLLYGNPPPGLDVRLSLDLRQQTAADRLLGNHRGSIVMLNASSGEILALASHPTFNPNNLDAIGAALSKDPAAPLLNRATQGTYAAGDALHPFVSALGRSDRAALYRRLGFYAAPQVMMDVAAPPSDGEVAELRISPLQMAAATSTLSNAGIRPAPRIVLAVQTLQQGWVVLPPQGASVTAVGAARADEISTSLMSPNHLYWEWASVSGLGETAAAWFIGGTLPNWQGVPLSVVVLVEGDDVAAARKAGEALLEQALISGL